MKINEMGSGRRVRCPICNCMFTFDKEDVIFTKDNDYGIINCPDCNTTLKISTIIEPKQDIFIVR